MSFTVTPQPNNVPPRVRIDIGSDDPSKPFTSLVIRRDGKPIREQPFAGSATAVAFDYEAPFGSPVSYSAEGSFSTSPASIYSTSWADLSGWSTVSGTPSVADGRFGPSWSTVERSVSLPTAGRITLSEPLSVAGGSNTAELRVGAGLSFSKAFSGTSIQRYVTYAGVTVLISHTSGALVAQWDATGLTVSTSSGSWRLAGAWNASSNVLHVETVSGGSVPGFAITDAGTSTPFSASANAYFDVLDAWLIHPSKPALSIPVESGVTGGGVRFIEASSGDSKTSQAVSTIHRPVGRKKAVVVTSGPRQADEWSLVIGATTIQAKNDVRAIVDDQTPLLFRSPADMGLDLPDDWYAVGDFTVNRVETPVITQMTTMVLPLTPVDEPIVRQGALWTWGSVLTRYATWQAVLDRNETWLDVLAGPS